MQFKICCKCKIEKYLSEFYKQKDGKFGVRPECIECSKKKVLLWYKNNNLISNIHSQNYYKKHRQELIKRVDDYHKIKPWIRVLCNINQRCNNKNSSTYFKYGAIGIKSSITSNELKELWFRDKAHDMAKPSIDRIDNKGDYTFNNCRFIEHKINSSKRSYKNNGRKKKNEHV